MDHDNIYLLPDQGINIPSAPEKKSNDISINFYCDTLRQIKRHICLIHVVFTIRPTEMKGTMHNCTSQGVMHNLLIIMLLYKLVLYIQCAILVYVHHF